MTTPTLTAAREQLQVHVRWLIRADVEQVLAIEQASFPAAPWTEEDLRNVLLQKSVIGMIAERGMDVVGFMVYELHKHRLHLLNFAVRPDCRRQGVGSQMVAKLASKLASHRRQRITLVTEERNLGSQLFWRACGFWCDRTIRDYFDHGDVCEDGYRMRLDVA